MANPPTDPARRLDRPLGRRAVLGLLAAGTVLPILGEAAKAPPLPPDPPPDHAPNEPSPADILAHPGAVDPFAYASLVGWLWQQGRRQQAALWFYVFQIRTKPWAEADRQGDGASALRASLNETLGPTINQWVGSDLRAWQSIAGRAVTFESHLPLYPEHPPGLTRAQWLALVATTRADYARQMHEMLDTLQPDDFAAKRRAGGLPVEPLKDPGPPLPDGWR